MALFQATVPNTFAAGVASLAVWRKHQAAKRTQVPNEAGMAEQVPCECGLTKARGAFACARCSKLDGNNSYAVFDGQVLDKFRAEGDLVLGQLIELFNGNHDRNTLYRACRRLVTAGKLGRRSIEMTSESFVYYITVEPKR